MYIRPNAEPFNVQSSCYLMKYQDDINSTTVSAVVVGLLQFTYLELLAKCVVNGNLSSIVLSRVRGMTDIEVACMAHAGNKV